MELALSLGDTPKPFSFLNNPTNLSSKNSQDEKTSNNERRGSSDPPIQLNLLPFSPVLRSHPSSQLPIPWLTQPCSTPVRELDVNRFPVASTAVEDGDDGTSLSSPNSAVSPFQMDFSMRNNNNAEYGGRNNKRDNENGEGERVSDDDENGCTRKKLRLSKEQSAFLEESFKEHTTLNPVSCPSSHKVLFFFLFLLPIIALSLLFLAILLLKPVSKNITESESCYSLYHVLSS